VSTAGTPPLLRSRQADRTLIPNPNLFFASFQKDTET
jgi:hypothetical protein